MVVGIKPLPSIGDAVSYSIDFAKFFLASCLVQYFNVIPDLIHLC